MRPIYCRDVTRRLQVMSTITVAWFNFKVDDILSIMMMMVVMEFLGLGLLFYYKSFCKYICIIFGVQLLRWTN